MKGLDDMLQQRRRRGTPAAIAAVTALAALAGAAAGCAGHNDTSASRPTTMTFVGKVADSRAYVALVVRGDSVRAYVCDGRKVGRWFDAGLAGHSVAAAGEHGSRLNARVADGAASGSVALDGGAPQRFEAIAAHGDAGLYRGTGHGYTGGWIVLADGSQRGVFGTKTTAFSAPALSSKAIIDGRIAITPIPIPEATRVPIPIHVVPAGGLGV